MAHPWNGNVLCNGLHFWNGSHRQGQDRPDLKLGYPDICGERQESHAADEPSPKEFAMNTFHARGVWLTLSLCILSTSGWAQDFGSPSLLYPQYGNTYPITPATYGRLTPDETLPSPSDMGPPMNAPMAPMAPMNQGLEYGNGYDGGYNTYPAPAPAHAPAPYQPGADYNRAMSADWGDGCSNGGCDSYGGDCYGNGCGGCRGGWFGYAGGLIMTRSQTGGMPLSYNAAQYQVLNTNQVEQPWMGGAEFAFGKWFCNCRVGLEAVYWGVFPTTQAYDYSGAGTYSAIDYGMLEYNNRPYNDYWENAQRQYIRRENSFNNIELNLIGNAWNIGGCGSGYIAGYGGGGCCDDTCGSSCGSGLTVGWLAGLRYFDFQDDFYYASSTNDTMIDGTIDEVFYINNVQNQLIGFQMGGYLSYQLGCRFSIYSGAKAGIFNNHANMYKRLYGTAGDAMIGPGPYAGQAASANVSSNTLACLGQLDLGMRYQATCHFAVRAGYRLVGVSGVALSDDQFLYNYDDYGAYNDIDTNGSLILHGAYAGGEFCW